MIRLQPARVLRLAAAAARLCAMAALAGLLCLARPGHAQQSRSIVIEAGLGRVISLGAPAASVFAADPKVIEVRPASATSLFVFGIAPGRTTMAALSAAGAPIAQWDVIVRPSGFSANEARGAIRSAIPGAGVTTEVRPNGFALTGEVATPGEADRAARLARSFLAEKGVLENRLSVSSPIQVNLRVRIVEMSRTLTRELGINWQVLGNIGRYGAVGFATSNGLAALTTSAARLQGSYRQGTTDINKAIDALSNDQLIRLLAEPNLTTMSGEPASFLVGGEFPIPVAQANNTISLEFKQYGVSLAFVPTVTSGDHIVLHVRPEVSELTNNGAVQTSIGNNSISIPALTVRRAETTVELGSGQSFAIAGLLQENHTLSANTIPFLGDIPILGSLFRSDSFQEGKTELVIVVTPYVVRPVSDPASIALPDDGWKPPSDLERILLLRQKALGSGSAGVRIPGNAGFVLP